MSGLYLSDAIIREPKPVDAGMYIERNVRLAFTCLAEKFQTANWGQIFVSLEGLLIFTVHMFL